MHATRTHRDWRHRPLLVAAFLAAACGGGGGGDAGTKAGRAAAAPPPKIVDAPGPQADGSAGQVPDGTPAALVGTVAFVGEPPARQELPVGSADGCGGHDTPPLNERVIVNEGKLANVFVWVSKGLEGWHGEPPPSEPLVVHQTGCIYQPHVSGLQAGRPIQVENRDAISHNVHLKSQRNGEPNSMQAAGSGAIPLRLDQPEVPVTFVCDLHPWMKAYVCIVEHPYFDVTGEDGAFAIEGLPAGKYTLSTWHEAYGRQRIELELGPGGRKQVDFSYTR